jgi:phenylacetate-CoA ligase
VRYRTGDRGALLATRCPCGRGTPLLGVVSGREADMLELPDGTTRSPYQLTMALERIPRLAQYRIVQAERGLLRVDAIATTAGARTDTAALERAIRDALREELPHDVRLEVSTVERLERGPREKLRVVNPLPRSRDVRAEPRTAHGVAR